MLHGASHFLTTPSQFPGNTLVLHGSLKYNVLKMERFGRALVEMIALLHTLTAIILYFPVLITLIAEDWVLGAAVCVMVNHGNYLLILNVIWLVLVMSGYRLWVLKKPKGQRLGYYRIFACL